MKKPPKDYGKRCNGGATAVQFAASAALCGVKENEPRSREDHEGEEHCKLKIGS
jgi:hypothetical protein